MDKIAAKLIQRYQTSSCQQLYQDRAQKQGQPKSMEEQRAITILRNDPQMRQAFINKIAAPIANKMFECGMIP
jgi:transposase-like protein